MGVKLIDALRTFRVEAEITGRTTGPVVTQIRGRARARREGSPDREFVE